jgi:hypothetical protein
VQRMKSRCGISMWLCVDQCYDCYSEEKIIERYLNVMSMIIPVCYNDVMKVCSGINSSLK